MLGTRPKFGNPSMAVLSVGGNDIDFPGIIFNCIIEVSLFVGGPKYRTCEDQRQHTSQLLYRPGLADDIDQTIKKVVRKGRSGSNDNSFRLYVTGFPQFFSTATDECDSVTFARSANPKPDGKEHTMMTQDLRKEFNQMSVQLNKAIEEAVSRNTAAGVAWVPIDGVMDGHRYCEPGIKEPDQRNPNLWLFHYPYDEPPNDDLDRLLATAYQNVSSGIDVKSVYPNFGDFENAVLSAMPIEGDPHNHDYQDWLWRGVGARAKVFHPQIILHEKIRDLVLDAYIQDLNPRGSPGGDKNACHGINGDYWIMSRDTAVANVHAFCQQSVKNVTYNEGSVNELSLSIQNVQDTKKGPSDDPHCIDRFQNAVIDGCDGGDPINNPHNYKFGSTLTTSDGWVYTMTPMSKQVNEVSCDVSYKFFFDGFEIRGKNLPDAKFGANGEGLHQQLSGCGALTKWNFEQTPNDVKFQWYASGQLPVGTKSCIGRALVSAGGVDHGNCHGPGKRAYGADSERPASIDSWPGYGDDDRHVFGQSNSKRSAHNLFIPED